MCTINKSAHTKKVWKLIVCTSYMYMYMNNQKKGVVKKTCEKMQYFPKAKITVTYSQDIILDDNTNCLSLFRLLIAVHR